MIFFEYLKTQLNKEVNVSLKNSMVLKGTLMNVDHFLNIQLLRTVPEEETPGLGKMFSCSVRGSSIKYIDLEKDKVLEDRVTDSTYIRFSLDKR